MKEMPLFNRRIRRWTYAIGEVVSVIICGICFPVLFIGHRAYRIGSDDPGMARITAICFLFLSVGTFILCNALKKIDHDK